MEDRRRRYSGRRVAALGLAAILLGAACGPSGEQEAAGQAEADVDLLIMGGTVLTMDESLTVYDPGYVAIVGEEIIDVGKASEGEQITARRRIDARGGFVMPGLVNGHQHAPMSLLRGVADDLTLMRWLEDYIFPAEKANVDEDFVYWGTLLSVREMIGSGTTTYADMYYFEDRVAQATALAGMRGVLGETILGFPSPDHPDAMTALKATRHYLQKWKGHPLIVPAVAPHSVYTCSTEVLKASKRLADEMDVPLIIHLAEVEDEVRQIREKHGTTPTRYLEQIGFLSDRVIAAHAIWVEPEEIEILLKHGVGVIHNPESNMKLAAGVAPVPDYLKAGLDVGIGTDGPASNNNLDLFQEIDSAAKLHKLWRKDPTVLDAPTVLSMATRMGARALGLGDLTGSLERGKRADLILLSGARPEAAPSYDPYSTIVYSLLGSSVDTVVINGAVVFEEGRLTKVDESELFSRVQELKTRIWRSLGKVAGGRRQEEGRRGGGAGNGV